MGELEDFLETVIPRQIEADTAIHNGDAEPRFDLYSHNDPVTVHGAAGMTEQGWDRVGKTFRWLAGTFARADRFEFEVIAAGVSGDLAYTVGFEHSTVTRTDGEVKSYRLRVTHVYRRENGEWKIVHRHGDALSADPPDS